MNRLRASLIRTVFFLVALSFLPLTAATAGELDDIYRLADQKKYQQALDRLEKFLRDNPKDAQARFLQGLILTERKQRERAIEVFQELSTDFPDLPEPYNNLAVLYAEKGHYDKAEEALKQAVRTHPGYATAHENLGDIYAKMASQAYDRALRLNGNNPAVRVKLDLVRKMFTYPAAEDIRPPPPSALQAKQSPSSRDRSAPPPSPSQPVVSEKPPVAAVATEAKRPRTVTKANRKYLLPPGVDADAAIKEIGKPLPPLDQPDSPPVAVKKPPPVVAAINPGIKTTPAAEPPPAPATSGEETARQIRTEVKQAVLGWAEYWSSKNVTGYLSSYSKHFQYPPEFPRRKSWEDRRRRIISRAGAIRVTLDELRIKLLNANRAQAIFKQRYWSPRYKDQVKKTLSMIREDGAWKIIREYADG